MHVEDDATTADEVATNVEDDATTADEVANEVDAEVAEGGIEDGTNCEVLPLDAEGES